MSKMGSHYSFGHLKHKLWPKEGPGVELPGVCPGNRTPGSLSRESNSREFVPRVCPGNRTPGSLSRESARFDSRPLKVGNRPEILGCRRRATYRLESSRWELQLCFRPHFDPRSARKVMGLQSPGSPARRDFGTPGREKPFGCGPRGALQRIL